MQTLVLLPLLILVLGLAAFACGLVMLALMATGAAILGRLLGREDWTLAEMWKRFLTPSLMAYATVALIIAFVLLVLMNRNRPVAPPEPQEPSVQGRIISKSHPPALQFVQGFPQRRAAVFVRYPGPAGHSPDRS